MAMPVAAMKHLLVRPAVAAPLDPNFAPMVLAKRKMLRQSWASDGRMGVEVPKIGISHDLSGFTNKHGKSMGIYIYILYTCM